MSMEVSSNYMDYKNDYLERLGGKDKTEEIGKGQDEDNKNEGIPVPRDEYISSEKSASKPTGLYYIGKDENGNPKVLYDDPKKAIDSGENAEPGIKAGGPEKDKDAKQPKVESVGREDEKEEEVTGNTDAVDREIEKLKKQKQEIEQQLRKAAGDEEKTKELQKKLAQTESELSQKDNDTYRRQHTVFTSRA